MTSTILRSLVACTALVAVLLGGGSAGVHADGSGTVAFATATKRVAFNANEFTVQLEAKAIQTLSNCYADPSVIEGGAGASVTFGSSTMTDTAKTFETNEFANKSVTLTGQSVTSGQQPTYTLTTVTDPGASWTPNEFVGLPIAAENIIGGRLSPTILLSNVTYTANSLTDASHSLVPNQLVGLTVVAGLSVGTIASNDATKITLSSNWAPSTPLADTLYSVLTVQASATITANTSNAVTIAGTWTPQSPPQNTRFTIQMPPGRLTGSGGAVTYSRRDTGTFASYTSTTLTDNSKAWTSNEFTGAVVTSNGNTATVASNGATQLTLASAWTPATPPLGVGYVIQASLRDTSKSLLQNQLAGRNVVAITPSVSGSGGSVTYSSIAGSGASVTFGSNTLTDTSQSFPNLAGRTVSIATITGVVQSNTATVITLTAPWSIQPVNGSAYVIANLVDTSKSFATNELAGRTIVSGNNTAVALSNTATQIVLQTPWAPSTPSAGAAYTVTPQANSGVISSNTSDRMSLGSGWSPFKPAAGTAYYVLVDEIRNNIVSNMTQTISMSSNWSPIQPANGSTYAIINSQPISVCGLGSYAASITFDPAKLQYLSASNGSFLTSTGRVFQSPCVPSVNGSTITFLCATVGGTPLGPTGSGVLLTVRFKPLATLNDSTVVDQTTGIADIQGATIDHVDEDLSVLFARCADVSGNGVVSLVDVGQVLQNVGKTSSNDPNWAVTVRYDLNQSNAISLADVGYALDEVGQSCTYVP
jgi:hypothetical protein